MVNTSLTVFVGSLIAIGIVGTVVPVLPGLWLIWGASVLYGIVSGFGVVGLVAMILLTAIAVAGTAATYTVPNRKASGAGVSLFGRVFAVVVAVVGFFVIPVVGAPLGFALGILVSSLFQTRNLRGALDSTWATIKGMLAASGIQLGAGVLMAIVWVAWVVAG